MSDEYQLPEGLGGSKPVRSPRGVHRSTGPWTSTVHAFLQHLQAVNSSYPGAPQVLGIDDVGREVLSFIDGEVLAAGKTWRLGQPTPWPSWAQSEDCLVGSARLLRSFHEASASFVVPADAKWAQHDYPCLAPGEIVCHGDIGPHNTVYSGGIPIGFIDWDAIRPNRRLIEFGMAAWKFVPLGSDAYFEESDFDARPDLVGRLALFAREYGVATRAEVGWALQQAQQRSVEALRYFPISPGEAGAVLRIVAAELDWLQQVLPTLVSGLD